MSHATMERIETAVSSESPKINITPAMRSAAKLLVDARDTAFSEVQRSNFCKLILRTNYSTAFHIFREAAYKANADFHEGVISEIRQKSLLLFLAKRNTRKMFHEAINELLVETAKKEGKKDVNKYRIFDVAELEE